MKLCSETDEAKQAREPALVEPVSHLHDRGSMGFFIRRT